MRQPERIAAMVAFARVVEAGSFTVASRELGMSKSSLSKEVARLEVTLGVGLLRRTTRSMQLTEVGRAYHAYCVRLLDEMKSADAFLREFHDEPFGNLRIAAPVTFGNRMIVPALAGFIDRFIHVQMDLELTDRRVDIAQEDVDVAIVIRRDRPDQASSVELTRVDWGLYAAPAYLARHPAIRRPEDLSRHGFLAFRGALGPAALALRQGKRDVELKVRHVLRSNNSTSLMQAACQGIGIAHLPNYVTGEALQAGELVRLLPRWTSEARTAFATFVEGRFLAPRVRRFIEHLGQHFGTAPAAGVAREITRAR